MNNLNICIAGLGNVGSHLISTLQENDGYINFKANLSFNILAISAKNRNKKRICNINSYKWCDDPLDLLNESHCDVLIELIGEEKGISYDLIKKALSNKIHVITANKALLAKHGMELFELAERNSVLLLFEAAVAGGIPIIKTIKNNIFLNKFKKITGILNGTTNYILTTMSKENLSFNKVLSTAQSKGYTSESESKLDIGGLDSAHKLTLLLSIVFGAKINFDNNYINGIKDVEIIDIINANKLGYKIKLISEAFLVDGKIFSSTGPKLISKKNPLSNVDGVLNGILIETDQLTSFFLEGEGAGGRATASSVISDMFEIHSKSNFLSLGYQVNKLTDFNKFDIKDMESSYYLRIMTKDITGALSKITGFFNNFDVSFEKILQLPENNNNNQPIPIIITTHLIKRNKLLKSINQIEKQDFVLEKINIIPIDNS